MAPTNLLRWLVVLGLTALWDSISDYIISSPRVGVGRGTDIEKRKDK